jgi:hypothetical protein
MSFDLFNGVSDYARDSRPTESADKFAIVSVTVGCAAAGYSLGIRSHI